MNPRAVEITVVRDGIVLAHVTLGPGSYTIGRTEQNAIVLPDVGVSRRHATLHIDHESVWIEDGGSGNGTWYRGQRVDRQILGDGDELTVDRFHLRFNTGPEPTAESHQISSSTTLQAMRDVAKLVGMGRLSGVDFILDPDRTVIIGRSPACDVVLSEPVASREHAEVQRVEGVWWIRDRSSNGTWINGQRVREQSIQDGDRLKIGATELRFVISPTDSPVSLTRPLISRKPAKPAANSSIQPLLFGMILLFIGCTGVVVTGVALRPLLANRTQEAPPDPRLAQAQALLNEGKAEEAFNLLQLILKDSPNNPTAQQLYAKAVSARAQPATVAAPPVVPTPVATKAKATTEAPPVVKPVETPKAVETPKPVFQNNAAILQQGEAALAAGDTAKAIQIWEGLISTAPTSPEAAAASVRIAQVQKANSSRSDASWQAAQNAIKAGDYIAARNYLKDVLRSDPNREGAQSTLEGIQKKLRADADAAYKEGRRLEDIDDRSGASSQYRKVMSLIGDRNDELYKRAEARLAGVSG